MVLSPARLRGAILAALAALVPAAAQALPYSATALFLDAQLARSGGDPFAGDLELVARGDAATLLTGGAPGLAGFPAVKIDSLRLASPGAVTGDPVPLAEGEGFLVLDSTTGPAVGVYLALPDGDPELDLLGFVDSLGGLPPDWLYDADGAGPGAGYLNTGAFGLPLPLGEAGFLTVLGYGEPTTGAFATGAARYDFRLTAVPLPAAAPLLAAALGALALARRRRG